MAQTREADIRVSKHLHDITVPGQIDFIRCENCKNFVICPCVAALVRVSVRRRLSVTVRFAECRVSVFCFRGCAVVDPRQSVVVLLSSYLSFSTVRCSLPLPGYFCCCAVLILHGDDDKFVHFSESQVKPSRSEL